MTDARLRVAYHKDLLGWNLGAGHPTDPVRSRIATGLLQDVLADAVELVDFHAVDAWKRAEKTHWLGYLRQLRSGISDEWEGHQPELAETARLMLASTLRLWDLARHDMTVGAPLPTVGFAPQGAKHHAMRARSGGFCVLNDMAVVAQEATDLGWRVLYIDWDVHHGDGVEAITRANRNVLTASIHGWGIFPGTGAGHDIDHQVLNYPLEGGSEDIELHDALTDILVIAHGFKPDLVLLATGADGLAADPLGNLAYTIEGLAFAGERLGTWAGERGLPVIVGGAGGYLPQKETPETWAAVVASLYAAHSSAVRVRV